MHAQPPGVPARTTMPAAASRLLYAARRRPWLTALAAGATVLLLLGLGAGTGRALGSRDGDPAAAGQWQPASSPTPTGVATPDAAGSPRPDDPPDNTEVILLSATGDIIFGDASEGALPARDGAGFFDGVAGALAADLTMGNLEQPLTGDTGYEKCEKDADACHAFRAPPRYAAHLREGGFRLLNVANNHGHDYGPAGLANTTNALAQHDLAYTGERGQITVVDVAGAAVAVLGFSPYAWTNSLVDLDQARDVVTRATAQADVVVVQVHMGAEGAEATRVTPGTEKFFGENRGDPMAFARTVIDAGADLVVGHGPHVLRGLEFYQDRLIAYSLGNFAGGAGTLNNAGNLGLGAVLRVRLRADGQFAGGKLISTHMYQAGLPTVDPQQRSLALVRELTARDFPDTGPELGPDGEITLRA
jgi:hypothetical protein